MKIDDVSIRVATSSDIQAIAHCRANDPAAGPPDSRMCAYLDGAHHPQHALLPRIGYVAAVDQTAVGYIAGHLTSRHGCEGEVQYLFVAPAMRRLGIGTELLRRMALWFQRHEARMVCVCLDADSPSARRFYTQTGASQLSENRPLWFVWQDIAASLLPPD